MKRYNEEISLKKMLQKETGATLVEMLVAMSISVLVFGIITTSMVQFMLITRWGNSQLQISSDFQVANLWLGRDIPEASSFTPGAGTEYGTFNWADSSQQFRYSYDLINGELIREHLAGGIVQSTTTVSRHIADQGDVSFSLSGKLMTVSITSTSGDEVETINIQLAMRTR